MAEAWRSIPGYEGYYEASDIGRIRSVARIAANGRRWPAVVLQQAVHPSGHMQVHLSRANVKRTHWVHRLVLNAFIGPAPEGTEALHGNGDHADNRLTNLTWGTRSANVRDQVRHGVHFHAAKTHCPHGHPYDESNTYVHPDGVHRKCRTCLRAQWKRTNERRRAARKAA